MKTFAALFLLLTFFYQEVSAISCYACNSQLDVRCTAKKIPDYMKTNCTTLGGREYTMCRKIFQYMEFTIDGVTYDKRIIRECASAETKQGKTCYDSEGVGVKSTICNCDSDLCNSSTRSSISTITVFLVSIITLSFMI